MQRRDRWNVEYKIKNRVGLVLGMNIKKETKESNKVIWRNLR